MEEATLTDGWEFAAATGVGISVQGFAAVTATAVGFVLCSINGYEYYTYQNSKDDVDE